MRGEQLHERASGTEALSQGLIQHGGEADLAFAEPGLRPRYAPDLPFRVEHTSLRLEVDPAKPGIRGRAELTIRPVPAGLGPVVLELDSVTVDELGSAEGIELDWTHEDGHLTVRGLPPEGGTFWLSYAGLPARGLYYTGPTAAEPERQPMAWTQCQDQDGHHLFPCVDHPQARCTWSIEVVAPEEMEVVSNGRLVESVATGEGTKAWRWEQDRAIPAYLVTVVVAELDVYGQDGVRYLVPKGTPAAQVERAFHKTPAMIEALSSRLGVPYPWARYDQVVVHDFIFGGMENVAATTLTDLMLTDERASLEHDFDDLVVHELGHQWFGDLVTCTDWSQAWLNEGWATYVEAIWKQVDRGPEEADHHRLGWLQRYLGEHGSRYHRPLVANTWRTPIDLFDRHLYEKGGLVLHTLRSHLGEEGFWAGVQRYLEDNALQGVHTRDFQVAMERVTGRNLDAFFEAYVLGIGHPVITVKVEHSDELLTVSLSQTQSGDSVAETFPVRLPVTVVTASGSQTVNLPLDERTRVFALPCAEAPLRVEVDPHFSVLAEVTLEASRSLLQASLEGDPGIVGRIRAATALAKTGGRAELALLSAALVDQPYWGVRLELAGLVSKVGTDTAREALMAASRTEADPRVRRAIVAALGSFRHPEVFARFEELAVGGDPALSVEGEAARQLGRLQAPQARGACEALLERDSWGELLRMRALEGLGTTRDAAVLPGVLSWSGEDRPERCRLAAVAALGQLAKDVPEVRQVAAEALVDLARRSPFRVRYAAIGALGQTRYAPAVGWLSHLHQAAGDGRLQRRSYEARKQLLKAATPEDPVASLRRELETLRTENQALKSRLDRLEAHEEGDETS